MSYSLNMRNTKSELFNAKYLYEWTFTMQFYHNLVIKLLKIYSILY